MTQRVTNPQTAAISRRRLLQGGALVGIGAFVAACRPAGGVASPSAAASTPTAPSSGASEAPSQAASSAPLGGKLNFANWTAYIDLTVDPGPDGVVGNKDDGYVLPSPTLDGFKAATGIEVNYKEAVNDNEEFFGTDLQGPLDKLEEEVLETREDPAGEFNSTHRVISIRFNLESRPLSLNRKWMHLWKAFSPGSNR
jgi:hypothetical protein